MAQVRLAVRALIVENAKLLLVNAYPGGTSDLWCAPGGGVELHQSVPDNLIREVHEETGLTIAVGHLAGVNEFHDPTRDFHQVDLYFHAKITAGQLDATWQDVDQIVTNRAFFCPDASRDIRYKPDSLFDMAFGGGQSGGEGQGNVIYDPLEPIIK